MKVNVHIERLILEGLPVGRTQGPGVQAAVESELARLIRAEGLGEALGAGGAMPSVKAGQMQLSGDGDPTRLGRQIAHAVFGGMRR